MGRVLLWRGGGGGGGGDNRIENSTKYRSRDRFNFRSRTNVNLIRQACFEETKYSAQSYSKRSLTKIGSLPPLSPSPCLIIYGWSHGEILPIVFTTDKKYCILGWRRLQIYLWFNICHIESRSVICTTSSRLGDALFAAYPKTAYKHNYLLVFAAYAKTAHKHNYYHSWKVWIMRLRKIKIIDEAFLVIASICTQ